MKHIKLYESWNRRSNIVLENRMGQTISLEIEHGTIRSIQNDANIRFPFHTGQPVTVFLKSWACTNKFKVNGENPCPEEKVFGIKTKDIPHGHELRRIFPGKFRDKF
jgi:hypothetical protein